jgi:hypothetical protein
MPLIPLSTENIWSVRDVRNSYVSTTYIPTTLSLTTWAGLGYAYGMGPDTENMEAAVAAVRTCATRKALDGMLERFEIKDTQKTIDCLHTCMYKPETFTPPKLLTPEDELEFAKQIFLTGTWRLNKYYDRMGTGTKPADQVDFARAVRSVIPDIARLIS